MRRLATGAVPVLGLAALAVLLTPGQAVRSEPTDTAPTNPLGANAACYVCHIPFVKEELSKVHLKAEVTCIQCHGLSAGHANDEHIGATPPDRLYDRRQIGPMCRECHQAHDVAPEKLVARWEERRGEKPKMPAACTDCHGTHTIERPADERGGDKERGRQGET